MMNNKNQKKNTKKGGADRRKDVRFTLADFLSDEDRLLLSKPEKIEQPTKKNVG